MYQTKSTERALLILVMVDGQGETWTADELAEEFRGLVLSTGIEVVRLEKIRRKEVSPALYIGKGRAAELADMVREEEADVVIFNNELGSSQQRNLEDVLGVKTIDRTQLVLDIFSRHAHTQEGSLQVELAQLEYLLPRLRGKGIRLSRLGGGIGTRGPGEKKLEVDRRRISERIIRLKKDLAHVISHRDNIRKKRQKSGIPVCSLVGYTNAGKSTLLNSLTGDTQKTSSALFTTLDPVSRMVNPYKKVGVVITDTVGFIYKLPLNLVEAFKATLEELSYADLLLHVVDLGNENYPKLILAVEDIIKELGIVDRPRLLIFNKIDKAGEDEVSKAKVKYPDALFVSALNKVNTDSVFESIYFRIFGKTLELTLELGVGDNDIVSWLYEHGHVLSADYNEHGVSVRVLLREKLISFLSQRRVKYTV